MLRKTLAMLLCLSGLVSFKSRGQQADPATVQVIVVRHAEKEAGPGTDPDLSAAGRQRAASLAVMLKEVQVAQLYSTGYKRTQQTLAPLAEAQQLQVATYDPADLKTLAGTLAQAGGKTIVVAGHANTAPELVNLLLGENRYSTLPEDAFGNMWLVTIKNGKAISCLVFNTNYH